MRASLLQETLTARVQAHIQGVKVRPALVQGSPGIGKTQMVRQIASSMGIGYIGLHAPLMLNEDFGMPRFTDDREIDFATPGHKFPFVDALMVDGEPWPDTGILAVEEVAQSDASQQKIWANLFQERDLHGRLLKPGWYIIASGNRVADRAGANRILSHFNDRFTTYDFEPNLDDWCNWALNNGVRPEVVAYVRWKPNNLSAFDPALDKCPTPRAWTEGVSPVLDAIPPDALFETLKGDVGEGAGAEFTAFLNVFRALPNPDLILANPDKHAIPDKLDVLYALAGALAHRADENNVGNLITFATRMPPEFMVLTIRDMIRVKPALQETKAYVKWTVGAGFDALS